MIVELVGPPASGKSTVTTFLRQALRNPVKDKGVKRTGKWEDFAYAYPLTWTDYQAQHKTYTPDFSPEDNAAFRKLVMEKSLERMGLYMQFRDSKELFLWNRGITQIPIDAGMFSSRYNRDRYRDLCGLFPKPDVVVHVFVPGHIGWERYLKRKHHRHRRHGGKAKYSAIMTEEKYHERWKRFQELVEADVILDNTVEVRGSGDWDRLVRRIDI